MKASQDKRAVEADVLLSQEADEDAAEQAVFRRPFADPEWSGPGAVLDALGAVLHYRSAGPDFAERWARYQNALAVYAQGVGEPVNWTTDQAFVRFLNRFNFDFMRPVERQLPAFIGQLAAGIESGAIADPWAEVDSQYPFDADA